MPSWRSIRRGGSGGRISPLRGRPRLRLGCPAGAGRSDFAGFSRASIAVLSREMCPTRRSAWVSLISAACSLDGRALAAKAGEGPGKRRLAGHLTGALPTAQAAQGLVGGQHLDQQTGGWKVEHGFRDKGPCKGGAFGWRSPGKALPARQERLDPHHPQHADQLLVVAAQRAAHRIVEPGQKFFLNADPVCG